jgi:hypothetical protein
MSTLATNAITDASGGNTATINGQTPTESNMAGRNRIINGDMRIDQRNAGASISNPANGFAVDRFAFDRGASSATLTVQRSTVAPSGFSNSLLVTVGTAAAINAGDYSIFRHAVEGFNTADLCWGSANAQTVTLSFWVRSSLTGSFGVSFVNSAQNRRYVASYTINAANTWEYKTLIIPGDTSGTWTTDNSAGINLYWDMGVGATYSASAGSWGTGTSIYGLTSGVKLLANSGATWQITGVQLEAGSVATPFERRQYGQELALCQRYYEFIDGPLYQTYTNVAGVTTRAASIYFRVTKRSAPTVTYVGTSEYIVSNSGGVNFTPSAQNITVNAFSPWGGGYSSGVFQLVYTGTGKGIRISAEL